MCQSLSVVAARVPARIVWPFRSMVTVVAVKVAVQPWSQSRPMESKEPEARAGKMWAMRAVGGRFGRSSMAVWVDSMVEPSGRRTEMLGLASVRLVRGVSK